LVASAGCCTGTGACTAAAILRVIAVTVVPAARVRNPPVSASARSTPILLPIRAIVIIARAISVPGVIVVARLLLLLILLRVLLLLLQRGLPVILVLSTRL
jgi:hypothetical protein